MPRPPRRRRSSVPPIDLLERRTLFAAAVSFAPAVSFAAGTAPSAVAAADLNADGKTDLAVTDATALTVNVFFGTGTGTFTAGPVLALTAPATAIATADLNVDGRPDLVVAASPGNANAGPTVTTFLATGPGTFAAGQRSTIATGGGSGDPVALAVGLLNADTYPDVVATDYSGNAVVVLLGSGSGTFAAPAAYNVGGDPTGVAISDVGSDGKADVAVTATLSAATGTTTGTNTGPGLFVLTGTGTGQLTVGSVLSLPGSGTATLTAADLIGDGKADLVVGNAGPTLTTLVNSGTGTFTVAATPATAAGSTGVAVADFNLDGVPDVVSADGGTPFSAGANSVTVVAGAANGNVGAAAAFATGALPTGLAVADFNADGRPDLATADQGGGTVSVLINNTTVATVATKTALAVTPDSTPAGQPLTLSATVTANKPSPLADADVPTGSVNFYDGTTLVGSATLLAQAVVGQATTNSAVASLTLSTLSAGTHRLTARYAGDAAYAASASAAVTGTVTPTATSGPDLVATIAAVGLGPTVVPGQTGTVRVTLTNQGDAIATGTVTNTLALSLDAMADPADTPVPVTGRLARANVKLAPGASVTLPGRFTIPADVPLGQYLLLATVDADGTLAQSNAANDVVASTTAYTVATAFGTVGGRPNAALRLADADGTVGTFRLRGPGTGTVDLTDNGLDLTLTGTTAATAVTITTAAGRTLHLHDVSADAPLGAVRAPSMAINGTVALAGGAASLALGDLTGAAVTVTAGIRSLTVAGWTGGSLTAHWLGRVRSAGAFGPTVVLSGAGAPRGVALGPLTVAGDLTGPIDAVGSLAALHVRGGLSASVDVGQGSVGAVVVAGPVGSDVTFTAAAFPRRAVLAGVAVDPATDPRFRRPNVASPL